MREQIYSAIEDAHRGDAMLAFFIGLLIAIMILTVLIALVRAGERRRARLRGDPMLTIQDDVPPPVNFIQRARWP